MKRETSRERVNRFSAVFLDYFAERQSIPSQGLVCGVGLQRLHAGLEQLGGQWRWWSWFPEINAGATKDLDDRKYEVIVLVMPKEKRRTSMCLEFLSTRLSAEGKLFLVGSNDEGIRSAVKLGLPFLTEGSTCITRKHARVLEFSLHEVTDARANISQFRQTHVIDYAGTKRRWTFYPGVFAKGGLDPASRLLLDAVQDEEVNSILDFASGVGALLALGPRAAILHAVERDLFSIYALKENVPNAKIHWSADWLLDDPPKFELVLSNPPIHDGKIEDYSVLNRLLTRCTEILSPKGKVVFVVQHRVPLNDMLEGLNYSVNVLRQDRVFKVISLSVTKP